MSRAVDPGWGDAVKRIPLMLVPTRALRSAAGSTNGLTAMRALWINFVVAVLVMGVAVAAITVAAPGGGADGRVVAAVVAAIGVFLQLVAPKFVRTAGGSTPEQVRASAQSAFFIRVMFAEPAALIGFMGFVLSGNAAVYVLGAAVAMVGLWDAAPTGRWIDENQQSLRESGSDVDFLAAVAGGGITR